MNLTKLYRSGFVQRYHQNPEMARFGQTNAAHQWGVATLIKMMNPNASNDLITAALFHDVGEIDVGDLAGPFKRNEPEFSSNHQNLEFRYRSETLGVSISAALSSVGPGGMKMLNMCDKLEAVLFVGNTQPALLFKRGWPETIKTVMREAKEIGCAEKVKELICDVTTFEDLNDGRSSI